MDDEKDKRRSPPFGHKEKRETVTVNGKPSDDLSQELLNSIWKQAGWK